MKVPGDNSQPERIDRNLEIILNLHRMVPGDCSEPSLLVSRWKLFQETMFFRGSRSGGITGELETWRPSNPSFLFHTEYLATLVPTLYLLYCPAHHIHAVIQ